MYSFSSLGFSQGGFPREVLMRHNYKDLLPVRGGFSIGLYRRFISLFLSSFKFMLYSCIGLKYPLVLHSINLAYLKKKKSKVVLTSVCTDAN